MQLSPRQYQVDPTGSAYAQDTRPLMAAMGAQAASQIESNRMMTETMQRGMQGIEDFAARRQLAAARAQLGALNIEDETYGQKLSELVMDNPLAFTNRKTAAVANMAFKQAGEDFRNKRDNEMRMAMQAQEFSNSRDLASMSQANQMTMANIARSAEIQAKVYAQESAFLSQEKESVLKQMAETDSPVVRRLLGKQLQGINAKMGQLSTNLETRASFPDLAPYSSIDTAPPPLPTESPAQNVAPMGSAGNGIPLPLAGEEGNDPYNLLLMGLEDGGAYGSPSVVQAAPVPEFTAEDGLPPAPAATPATAPAATPATAAAATPATAAAATPAPTPTGRPSYGLSLEEEQQLNTLIAEESKAKAQAKKSDTMTASELADKEKFTEDLSYADPEISKLSSEVESLKNTADALKTVISNTAIPSTEQQNKYLEAVSNLSQKQFDLAKLKANFRTGVRFAGGPDKYVAYKIEQEKTAREEALKANADAATAAANARLASAFAGTPSALAAGGGTLVPPAPLPDPTIGMSALERDLYNIESKRQEGPLKRKAEQEARMAESNQQWSRAKGEVYKLIGGSDGLAELLGGVQGLAGWLGVPQDQPLMEDIDYNANIPENRPKLANELAQKIREKIAMVTGDKKLKGFEQKLARLGSQKVSQEEIIAAVVDEIIRGQKTASEKVGIISRASAAQAGTPIPQPVRQALGNTELIPR